MSQPRDDRQDDLFRPSLEKIINVRHPLVRLVAEIDWDFLAGRFSSVCRVGPGQPPLPTRSVAGLFILKHMQQESLSVANRSGAIESKDLGASSNSCAPGSEASFATSAARSKAISRSRIALVRCSISPIGSATKQQRQRGPKVYSLHAPEVECIGKARSGRPTPFSSPLAATSACSCAGSRNSCVSCYDRLTRPPAAAPCLVRRSETFFTDDSATICPPSLTEQR